MIFDSLETTIVVALIIFVSQIIYSILGFGSGMFAISIFSILFDKLDFYLPFFMLLCFPTEIYITYKDRKHIDFKKTWVFLIFIIPLLLFGSYLLKNLSTSPMIYIVLGIIIVILSIYYLYEAKHPNLQFDFKSKLWLPFFAGLSGVLGGLFGMAGPPLILYFKNLKMEKQSFRVALLSIFVIMTFFRLTFYTYFDLINMEVIYSASGMIIFALGGLWFGNFLHHRISEKKFALLTSWALICSGILIIIKNVWA